jgi:hypothetical protein
MFTDTVLRDARIEYNLQYSRASNKTARCSEQNAMCVLLYIKLSCRGNDRWR